MKFSLGYPNLYCCNDITMLSDKSMVGALLQISNLQILAVGQSDHLGTLITKFAKELRTSPRTTKKRVYKNFDQSKFKNDMTEAKNNGLFIKMHETLGSAIKGSLLLKKIRFKCANNNLPQRLTIFNDLSSRGGAFCRRAWRG